MAYASLCLLRRSSSAAPPRHTLCLAKISPFLFRPLSTTPLPLSDPDCPPPSPPPSSKPPSLSARLSFVFDQIDAIDRDRDRKAKDEALQRIRQWRQNRHPPSSLPDSPSGSSPTPVSPYGSSPFAPETSPGVHTSGVVEERMEGESMAEVFRKEVELAHPWPEWIELMERLAQQNYFDLRRMDEQRVAANVPIDLSGIEDEVGFDFSRDWTTVRNACMNFGRDRFDIVRSLSRKDLQILVGHGCPSMDPKVVFSAKLLRKLVHLDEGDVCSSCNLRNSCSRGYILTPKEDSARTLDVMRVLLTFAFDHTNETVENKPLMKMKSVKTVVRKLLHEIVKLSAVPIDPNLPPPVIKKPPPKVKQPPPPPRKRVGRDDVEMKKGDWLCPKCDFMNFAKNTVCMQCDAKRPKRQLLPGEWECPQCNFLNYRRNMACFHCDHKRPPDEFTENMQARQSGPRTRFERTARMPDVSSSWNFDFDDNESDGADVAAFEFADSPKMGEDSSLNGPSGIARGFEEDVRDTSREPRIRQRERYSSKPDERKSAIHSHRTGFDDFDDEEDDDVDSYELDVSNNSRASEVPRKNFSELESTSGSEDFDEFDGHTNSKWSAKDNVSDSEDDDPVHHPYWKSSRAADSKQKAGGNRGSRPLRGMSFGSDDDDLGSDSDDMDEGFRSRPRKSRQENPARMRKGRISDSDDELDLDFESDEDNNLNSSKNKMRGNQSASRGSRGEFRRDVRMGNRRHSFDNGNDDLSRRDSGRYNSRSHGNSYSRRKENDRFQSFDELSDGANSSLRQRRGSAQFNGRPRGPRRNERGKHENGYSGQRGNDGFQHSNWRGDRNDMQRGRTNQYNDRFSSFDDHDEHRPRRRIIER